MSKRITVLDDELDILYLVNIHLERAGFIVDGYSDTKGFFESFNLHKPDLIILDLMLPDMDGFDICKVLKKDPRCAEIPVIMLTAKGQESDKIKGFDLGADDYITKPFSPRELIARIKAVLRRSGHDGEKAITVGGSLVIDPERFVVTAEGTEILLTLAELRILHMLATNMGKVFSREKILDHLWGNEKAVLDRTVDVHIKNLRGKLGSYGKYITSIRGVGYKMEE